MYGKSTKYVEVLMALTRYARAQRASSAPEQWGVEINEISHDDTVDFGSRYLPWERSACAEADTVTPHTCGTLTAAFGSLFVGSDAARRTRPQILTASSSLPTTPTTTTATEYYYGISCSHGG